MRVEDVSHLDIAFKEALPRVGALISSFLRENVDEHALPGDCREQAPLRRYQQFPELCLSLVAPLVLNRQSKSFIGAYEYG